MSLERIWAMDKIPPGAMPFTETIRKRVDINTDKIGKLEKDIYGENKNGLFYEYITSKKILKILLWLFGILITLGTTVGGILIKRTFELSDIVIRNQAILEILISKVK